MISSDKVTATAARFRKSRWTVWSAKSVWNRPRSQLNHETPARHGRLNEPVVVDRARGEAVDLLSHGPSERPAEFFVLVRDVAEERENGQQHAHGHSHEPDAERSPRDLQRGGVLLEPYDQARFEHLRISQDFGDDLRAES